MSSLLADPVSAQRLDLETQQRQKQANLQKMQIARGCTGEMMSDNTTAGGNWTIFNPGYQPSLSLGRQGWVCPKCQASVSPDEKTCPKCIQVALVPSCWPAFTQGMSEGGIG